ncbi:hypothetical protein ABPG74_011987 [Tetrahymena malaccensis]
MDFQQKEATNIQLEEIKIDYNAIALKNSQYSQNLYQKDKYQAQVFHQRIQEQQRKIDSIEKQNISNNLEETIVDYEASNSQNQSFPKSQNRNLFTRNQQDNISNQLNNQIQKQNKQKNQILASFSKCGTRILSFICMTIIFSLDLSFGILFQKSLQDEQSDKCDNNTLLKWASYTSICSLIRASSLFVLSLFYLTDFKIQCKQCGIIVFLFFTFLFLLASTCLYYCFQGLQYSNSSDCGQIYKITQAYIISNYIIDGIAILILCIIGLYFIILKLRQ